MRNLPINKKIEKMLKEEANHRGIFEIKGRNQYLKLTSKSYAPIMVPYYKKPKRALKNIIRCAKVYQRLIEEGIYHPKTGIVIYKDKGNLALMVIMPRLTTDGGIPLGDSEKERLETIIKKFNLKNERKKSGILGDIFHQFNWGYDKKGDRYVHDLHVAFDYKTILKLADKMKIPKTRRSFKNIWAIFSG